MQGLPDQQRQRVISFEHLLLVLYGEVAVLANVFEANVAAEAWWMSTDFPEGEAVEGPNGHVASLERVLSSDLGGSVRAFDDNWSFVYMDRSQHLTL